MYSDKKHAVSCEEPLIDAISNLRPKTIEDVLAIDNFLFTVDIPVSCINLKWAGDGVLEQIVREDLGSTDLVLRVMELLDLWHQEEVRQNDIIMTY